MISTIEIENCATTKNFRSPALPFDEPCEPFRIEAGLNPEITNAG
jgi:hypothetical protein